MNKEDLDKYHAEKIKEHEEANPDAKGLKHTLFCLEYKSMFGGFTRVTRIISCPHETTDEELDSAAADMAVTDPPMMCLGTDLISIKRGSALEILLNEQTN